MSYGYDSSTPSLTINLTPDHMRAARALAQRLGRTQTRGATAGEGSLSQLVAAIGQHAQEHGIRATASKLRWTTEHPPDIRWRTHTNLTLDDGLLPVLKATAKASGHVRTLGDPEQLGEGSTNVMVASIAQAALDDLNQAARRLQWLAVIESGKKGTRRRSSKARAGR